MADRSPNFDELESIEAIRDVIIISDYSGKILLVNNAACDMFGYTQEEFEKLNIFNLCSQETSPVVDYSSNSEDVNFEINRFLKDGSIMTVKLNAWYINLCGQPLLLSTISGISGNIKYNEQIRKLSAVVEQSQYAVTIADINGRIEYANPKFYSLTGLSPEEVSGKNLTDINDWENSPEIYQQLLKSLNEGQVWKGECCIKKSSGEIYWEDVTISPISNMRGEVVYFSRISSDVTEQRKVLEKLEEAYSNLDQILKSLGDGICVTDLNGNILKTNTTFAKMCELNQNDLIGNNSCKLCPTSYCNTDECCMIKLKKSQTRVERDVQFIDRKTGQMKYFAMSIDPFYSVTGEWIGLVKNYRDITIRTKLQENLNQDLMLAGNMQKHFIPKNENDERVIFETIYEPCLHVSGDIIDLGWNDKKTVMYGYVVDVMGHGMATALQTSALRVLFRQTFTEQLPPGEKLSWINQQSGPYFAEDSFAASIYFEFDFNSRTLKYSAAGLNHFLASANEKKGVIGIPGSLIGIGPTLYYDEGQIKFESGDYFCFISDGLLDILKSDKIDLELEFTEFVDFLRTTANSNIRKDDISAICIYIR